jgi:hypothetical protein
MKFVVVAVVWSVIASSLDAAPTVGKINLNAISNCCFILLECGFRSIVSFLPFLRLDLIIQDHWYEVPKFNFQHWTFPLMHSDSRCFKFFDCDSTTHFTAPTSSNASTAPMPDTTSTPTNTTAAPPDSGLLHKIPLHIVVPAAIVGGVVLFGILAWCCYNRRSKQKAQ